MSPLKKPQKLTRDGLLVLLGAVILVHQGINWQFSGTVEPSLVTAGTSIILSPMLLHRDEKK